MSHTRAGSRTPTWLRLAAQLCAIFVLFGGWLLAREARASHGGVEAMTRVSLSVLARVDTEGTCSVEQALEADGILDPCVAALMRAGSIETRLESGVIDHAARRCSVSLEAMFDAMHRDATGGSAAARLGQHVHDAPLTAPAPVAPELPWLVTRADADLPLAPRGSALTMPSPNTLSSCAAPLPPLPPPEVVSDFGSGLRA